MGSFYFWGHSIQEMCGNVVEGRSIYGVVVIDGSLYSDSTVPDLQLCRSRQRIYITCNLCVHMYRGV